MKQGSQCILTPAVYGQFRILIYVQPLIYSPLTIFLTFYGNEGCKILFNHLKNDLFSHIFTWKERSPCVTDTLCCFFFVSRTFKDRVICKGAAFWLTSTPTSVNNAVMAMEILAHTIACCHYVLGPLMLLWRRHKIAMLLSDHSPPPLIIFSWLKLQWKWDKQRVLFPSFLKIHSESSSDGCHAEREFYM